MSEQWPPQRVSYDRHSNKKFVKASGSNPFTGGVNRSKFGHGLGRSRSYAYQTSPPPTTTTGINDWWSYEERPIPGVGKFMVNVASGNLLIQADDVDIPEKGIDLAFRRTFNSQSTHDCLSSDGSTQNLFGNGWTNTFDAHVAFYDNNTVLSVYDVDGARYDYTSNGSGGWTPPPGEQGTSIITVSDGYEWQKKSGTLYYFKSPDYGTLYGSSLAGWDGRIRGIYGRNTNNLVTFNYTWDNNDASTAAHISKIVASHSDGQNLTLNFADVNGCRELTSMTRPDNQSINYHYANNQLTEVDRPGNPNVQASTSPTANQLPEAYVYQGTQSAPEIVIEGPRFLISAWNSGNNPQDGSGVYVDLNADQQVTDDYDDGDVNFEPNDGTNSYLQPTMPVNRKVWHQDTFSYDDGDTGIVDSDGHITQWLLDSVGRETLRQDYSGTQWLKSTSQWDANNDLTETTDLRGNATDYAYDANGNTIAKALPSVSNAGGTFRPTSYYSYDSYNNVTAYCDPIDDQGNPWENTPPAPVDNLCAATAGATRMTYAHPAFEPFGELKLIETPLGYNRHIGYVQSGTDYGLPISVIGDSIPQPVDSPPSTRTPTETFTYDTYGNVICAGNGSGTYALKYDSLNRRTVVGDPDDSSLNPLCSKPTSAYATASYTYYNNDGTVSETETPAQHATSGTGSKLLYDADGNKISDTVYFSASNPVVRTSWYDGDDRLVEVDNGSAYQSGWLTRYLYDLSEGSGVSLTATGTFYAAGNLFATEVGPLWTETKVRHTTSSIGKQKPFGGR